MKLTRLFPKPQCPGVIPAINAITASNVTGLINGSSIGGGTITSAQLANGAAAANLQASGQNGVATGGLVLSATENAALVNAGYVRINARITTDDIWQLRLNGLPPARRASHSAVWTGSEMIICGGFFNDGARYNPTTDTWTPTSAGGAPQSKFARRPRYLGEG